MFQKKWEGNAFPNPAVAGPLDFLQERSGLLLNRCAKEPQSSRFDH